MGSDTWYTVNFVMQAGNTGALLPPVCALSLLPRSGQQHIPQALQHLMDKESPVADVFDSCPVCDEFAAENVQVTSVWLLSPGPSIQLSVLCLSVSQAVCLHAPVICLSVCRFVCPSFRPSVSLSICSCLLACLSVCLSVLSICDFSVVSVPLSACWSYLFLHSRFCLSIILSCRSREGLCSSLCKKHTTALLLSAVLCLHSARDHHKQLQS